MDTIVVEIKGGMVQDITGIPRGVEVEVRDFDTDSGDPAVETYHSRDPFRELDEELRGEG